MARLAFEAVPRALNSNGDPASGALLYVYEAGTTTPVTVYSDAAMTAADTHPVVADSWGFFDQLYIPDGNYKVRVTSSTGALIYEADNVSQVTPGAVFNTRAAAIAGNTGTDSRITVNGLAYKYDAAGTALTTGDGRTWSPDGDIYWDHFGAVGNGEEGGAETDDSAAMQACVDYCGVLATTWDSDDRASNNEFGARVRIKGRNGATYAMASGILLTVANRGLIIDSLSARAIGNAWTPAEFMIGTASGDATFVTHLYHELNCNHKCSGLEQRANSNSYGCEIKHPAGDGIKLNGTRCGTYWPRVKQWDVHDAGFYTPGNFTATAVHLASDDCWIVYGFLAWSKYNVYVAPGVVNCHIDGVHTFNGMEDFASHIDQATGLTAVGRNDPNIYIAGKADVTTRPNVFIRNCYLDNGHIEMLHTSVSVEDCSYHSNALHSPVGAPAWHVIHAERPSDVWRGIIDRAEVGVRTRVRNWVDFQEQSTGFHAHTFDPNTAADLGNDLITIASHEFVDNDMVLYGAGGGTPIVGLTGGASYFIVGATTNTFQLSATRGGAAIDLTGFGTGTTHTITDQHLWVFDDTVIEGAPWNVADASNSPFSMTDTSIVVSLSPSIAVFHGQGPKAYIGVEDNDSTVPVRFGADADAAIIESTDASLLLGGIDTTPVMVKVGTGTPEAVVTAVVGSMFLRTDGGAGTTLYIKESGTGNTGWAPK